MTATSERIWVDYMRLGDVQPAEVNPKGHDGSIAESIGRFGFNDPLALDERTGRLVEGHGRLEELKALRDRGEPPPGRVQIAGDGEWLVPVVRGVSFDNDGEAAAYLLAHNKTTEAGGWNTEELAGLLGSLRDDGVELEGLGWEAPELDDLLGSLGGFGPDIPPSPVPSTPLSGATERHPVQLIQGECVEAMRAMDDNSIDSGVMDPPYGIGFMGKDWDADLEFAKAWAAELYRVCKPGAHVLAFGAPRTVHRLAVALEDAGFEIRDQLVWLHWAAFPAGTNVGKAIDKAAGFDGQPTGRVYSVPDAKQTRPAFAGMSADSGGYGVVDYVETTPESPEAKRWEGWHTRLRPIEEPIVLARKPPEGTVAQNVLKWGVGALNIDACRHLPGDALWPGPNNEVGDRPGNQAASGAGSGGGAELYGRRSAAPGFQHPLGRYPGNVLQCPRVSTAERNWGCDGLSAIAQGGVGALRDGGRATAGVQAVRNDHPTVKPIALMRHLVRLVTPPGGVVLDTFAGSGTTGIAAVVEGMRAVLIERDAGSYTIAEARCAAALKVPAGQVDEALHFEDDNESGGASNGEGSTSAAA